MKRALLCFFATFLIAGCGGKDPAKPQPPVIEPPPGRTTPQQGVEYYRLAWENRDSTRVDSVLAAGYQGTSTEIGPNPVTLSFVKSDEIRALHNMKDDVSITQVTLDFGPPSSWTQTSDPGDPPGWALVIVHNFQILINRYGGSDLAVSSSSGTTMEFKLEPTASGTDTTWQIVRWKETYTQ